MELTFDIELASKGLLAPMDKRLIKHNYIYETACQYAICAYQYAKCVFGCQMAEQLGNRATNQKVAGLIPGCAKQRFGLGQGTLPYLPLRNVLVLTISRSG